MNSKTTALVPFLAWDSTVAPLVSAASLNPFSEVDEPTEGSLEAVGSDNGATGATTVVVGKVGTTFGTCGATGDKVAIGMAGAFVGDAVGSPSNM